MLDGCKASLLIYSLVFGLTRQVHSLILTSYFQYSHSYESSTNFNVPINRFSHTSRKKYPTIWMYQLSYDYMNCSCNKIKDKTTNSWTQKIEFTRAIMISKTYANELEVSCKSSCWEYFMLRCIYHKSRKGQ